MIKNLTSGSPAKLLVGLSVPMIFASIFQQMYNTVDAVIVGNFLGGNALAAVGLSFPVVFLLISIIMGISMGVSVIISQYFGAKQYDKVRETVGTAVVILFLVTLVLSAVGFIFTKQFLIWMGTPNELLTQASEYLRIIFAGAVFTLLYNVFSAVLRGVGDMKSPLYFLLLATGLNIVLDIVFIAVFHMGVDGAALATIISQAVASVFCMMYIHKKIPLIRMPFKEYRIHKEQLTLIFKFGTPSAIQQGVVSIGLILLQGIVNSFGTNVIAGYTAATRIDSFITLPYMNIGLALSSFVGQNMGAGNIERVRKGLYSAVKIMGVLAIILLPILWFGGGALSSMFLDSAETKALHIGATYLRDLSIFYFILGVSHALLGVLRGAGDNAWAMAINVLSLAARVGTAFYLTGTIGVRGLWFAAAIGWVAALVVSLLRYKSKRWESMSIIRKGAVSHEA